jgi:hypothetical protein
MTAAILFEILWALLLIVGLLAATYSARQAGWHRARVELFGVMADAIREMSDESSATDLAKRFRQLAEARGLWHTRPSGSLMLWRLLLGRCTDCGAPALTRTYGSGKLIVRMPGLFCRAHDPRWREDRAAS